jgi:hypothetical protein
MMQTKQWSVDTEPRTGGYAVVAPDGKAVAIAIQRDPHPSMGQGITCAEALAHAHMIAAAPSLLFALIGLDQVFCSGDFETAEGRAAGRKALIDARTAISKAQGAA